VYAPKNDALHREDWHDPYPQEFLDHFAELARLGQDIGVRFFYALAPGLSFDPNAPEGNTDDVHAKLATLLEVGVRDFCLFFDDIQRDQPGADPQVQVDLVNSTLDFLRRRNPQANLCFISNFYAGTTEEMETDASPFQFLFPIPSSTYYETYKQLAADVPILWTGPRVFTDRLTLEESRRFRHLVGRPVIVWDNYPVNDAVLTREIFLGPYRGRDAGLGCALDGILLNPMLQPEATKIALWTAGRYFALGSAYDPDTAWEEALTVVSNGQGTEPLRTLAAHMLGHPLIGDNPESPELAHATADFFANRSPESEARLRALFATYARNHSDLEATLGNPVLLAELTEPARKLSLLGEAGLLALDLLADKTDGIVVDTTPLGEQLTAIAAIPWHIGANTAIPPALARLLGEHEAAGVDVFQSFFDHVLQELEG
jgi:hyaluronoglucosaminidase